MIDFNVAMDIETSGLNPWESRLVTAAFVGNQGDDVEVYDEPTNEELILTQIEQHMRQTRIEQLIGWNHTEFDLPFLAVRFVLNGIDLPPFLKPMGEVGKYGKPRYGGYWYGAKFVDVAYDYEEWAKEHGVKWGLKPVAKAKHLGGGVEIDFNKQVDGFVPCQHPKDFGGTEHSLDPITRPFTILDLDKDERKLYCVADAQMVMALFMEPKEGPKGQAVTLEGGLTIL